MGDVVQRIDSATIAAVIEANINAELLSFALLPGAVLHDGPRSVWLDTGSTGIAYFNQVVHADFASGDADAAIEEIVDHFRRHGRSFTWQIGPVTRPADLDRFLPAHGLTFVEDEPGMAVELDHLHQDAAFPPQLEIETVRDLAGLKTWVDVWLFPVPEEARPLFVDAFHQRGFGDESRWRYYLGRSNGQPVAVSALSAGEGVAGVQYVVTVPAARRRGIGMALTLRVLREARALGYRVAVLTASPDGEGIYRRIGFREYCRVRRYEWEPPS